jgi:hypothetical protein
MTAPNERAYQDACTQSEGRHQADIAALDPASSAYDPTAMVGYPNYDAAVAAAQQRHWRRVIDAAKANNMSAPNIASALAEFRNR